MTMININIDLVTNSEHFYCWKKQSKSYLIGQIYSRNDVVFVGAEFITKNPTSLDASPFRHKSLHYLDTLGMEST